MNRLSSYVIFGALVGIFLLTCMSAMKSSSQAKHPSSVQVLKLAHGLEEGHPVHKAIMHMKASFETATHGATTIDVYSNAVLGGELECMEQVQKGTLAMTKISLAAVEAFVSDAAVFGMPFIFRDSEHYWKVLEGKTGQHFLNVGQSVDFQGLCYYDAGARSMYSTKKPIHRFEDIIGMKIRVMQSRTAVNMINVMQASPCPINWGELYSALSQGTVDGAENNPPSFISSRHYEVCKYFTLTEHQRIPDMLIINSEIYAKLSPEVKLALSQAAQQSSVYQRKLWNEATQDCMKQMKENGVTIITPNLDDFRKVCSAMLNEQPTSVKEHIQAILEAQ